MNHQADYLEEQLRLARAEVAELRKRVCVPEGWVVVPSAVVEFLKGAGQLEGLWFGQSSIDRGAFWWRKYLFAISAAPAPVERCDTCYGHGEVPTGETQRFGDLQPPEPIMMACPECDGQAPLERLATDGGRNQRFEGLFEGETPDQRDARLASAAPVERVEQEAVAMLLIDDASVAESGDWDIEPIPAAIEKLARSGGATLPLYTTPQPAPNAAQDVAGLLALADAVTPQIIDWVRCGLSTNGHLTDGSHPALNKLREAYCALAHQNGGAK